MKKMNQNKKIQFLFKNLYLHLFNMILYDIIFIDLNLNYK